MKSVFDSVVPILSCKDIPYKFYLMVHSKDETARHKSDF